MPAPRGRRREPGRAADPPGNVVEVDFRFSTPSQGELLTVSMAGQFAYSEEAFSADGTAANILLPIDGQACQLQLVDVHLDATTRPRTSFAGLIRITTSTPRPGNLHLSGLVRVPGASEQSTKASVPEREEESAPWPTQPPRRSPRYPPRAVSSRRHPSSPVGRTSSRWTQYRELAAQAERDPEGYWGARGREELFWKTPFQTGAGVEAPVRQVVPRRAPPTSSTTASTGTCATHGTGRRSSSRASRGTSAGSRYGSCTPRCAGSPTG